MDYIGSISIDSDLMGFSGIVQNERVHVWNIANGKRLETYAIAAPAGSGTTASTAPPPITCQSAIW